MSSKFFGNQIGQEGWSPTIQFINASDEDLSTIISPGFVNNIIGSGNNLDVNAMLLIKYQQGTQLFQQSINNGLITLNVYNPGETGFNLIDVCFVAKGGADTNTGKSISNPKLTIQAAWNAVKSFSNGVVWVLDGGDYAENLDLTTANNTHLYMPNANLSITSGTCITLNDTGSNYVVDIECSSINATGFDAINVLGPQSNLFLFANVLLGDITNEGGMVLDDIANIASDITNQSTGQMSINVRNAIFTTITNNGGKIIGKLGNVDLTQMYGDINFNNTIKYFYETPAADTVGRTLTVSDNISNIQYNSVSDGNLTLPQTSSVAIPVGAKIDVFQLGIGKPTFVAGSGVTIISKLGANVRISGAGGKATLSKISDTVWQISDDIEAVGP